MNVKRLPGEIFVTDFTDRERTEVRRLSRPSYTKDERQKALVEFLGKRDIAVGDGDAVYVWA